MKNISNLPSLILLVSGIFFQSLAQSQTFTINAKHDLAPYSFNVIRVKMN